MLDSVSIKPESDVKILLNNAPFPHAVTRLELETTIEDDIGGEADMPMISRVKGRCLRLYDGARIVAATGDFTFDPDTRKVQLLKETTTFY